MKTSLPCQFTHYHVAVFRAGERGVQPPLRRGARALGGPGRAPEVGEKRRKKEKKREKKKKEKKIKEKKEKKKREEKEKKRKKKNQC